MEYMTVKEVMDELRVGKMTVHRLLQRGEFAHAFKITNGKTAAWRISREDIENFKRSTMISIGSGRG